MKIIGLDVGTVRIGVARVDTTTKIAIPDGYINVNGQEISEIQRKLSFHNSNVLVIGMPRSNDGNQTAQSDFVKSFTERIAATIPGLKIYFQDESLTSVEAENRLKSRKNNYQKGEIDAESAAIILQDFVERLQSALSNQQTLAPVEFTPTGVIEEKQTSLKSQEQDEKMPKKKNSLFKKTVISLFILLLLGGIGIGVAYHWYQQQLLPVKNLNCLYNSPAEAAVGTEEEKDTDCRYQTFEIKTNETINEISARLKTQNLIRSSEIFKFYLKLNQKSSKIKSGVYHLRTNMSTPQIADLLEQGAVSNNVFNLTILPGETIVDIRQKLIKLGYQDAQIDAALTKKYDSPILKGLYNIEGRLENQLQPLNVALEGYLYGETYQFYQGETVEHIFKTMIDQLNNIASLNQLEEKFQKRGLTLREGIILASIIQKEAHTEDMPGVSMVFQNRLRRGWSLGSDVTATYAADLVNPNRNKNDPNNNLVVLETDSLYNTRKHTGLPPGPICSPSISALLAVAEPDENMKSMYYFLTGDDGKMYYSVTDTEHEQKKRDFCQKLCNYGSKNKHVDESINNLNLQSISKKDYAVSTDQLSEFYVVSELASNLSLASSEVVNVNYNSLTTLRDSGQVSTEKMEKPIAPLATSCLKVGAIAYTVLEGDTIASITGKYAACGVTETMVRWSNNFKNTYEPKAGEVIYLPSRAGFVYKIKSGDTVESIAGKYGAKSDEIIAANNLELNQSLSVGTAILLPDGNLPETERPDYVAPRITNSQSQSYTQSVYYRTYWTSANQMPWGWCTWYAWQRRYELGGGYVLPGGLGNANTWDNALISSFPSSRGTNPQAGDVFQTDSGYYGHVGIVDSVNDDGTITISDMNGIAGWGHVGRKTVPQSVWSGYLFIHSR